MTKPKKTSEIEWELIGATKLKAKAGEDRDAYIRRMMDAIKSLGDDEWDALSEEAQLWYNTNIARKKERESFLDFDGDANEDDPPSEEPAESDEEPEADHEESPEEPEPETDMEDERMSTKKTAKKDKSAKKTAGKKPTPAEDKKKIAKPAKTSLKTPKPAKAEKPAKVGRPPKADKPAKAEKPARPEGKRPHTDVNRAVEIMIPMVAKDASLSEMQKALDKAGAEIAVTTMRACASWIRRVCTVLEKKGMLRQK